MNTSKLLAAEYAVAVSVVSWSAIKGDKQGMHYWPWPPTIIMTTAAFGILGLVSSVQPELAGILGAGFLLAQLIRAFGKGDFFDLSGMNSPVVKLYNEAYKDKGGSNRFYRILTF